MRSLLFHAREFRTEFDSFANRPRGIVHEKLDGKEKQECENCVVAFITVEKADDEKTVEGICKEILKMCKEIKRNKAVVAPFAHLSNDLAEPKKGLEIIKKIEGTLSKKVEVIAAHFGSNKSLLLDVYGHTGNARYREF